MSGITKTIPQKHGQKAADQLFDGSLDSFEFHMSGKPSKLSVGDFVYTIWQNELIGRCLITDIRPGILNKDTGKAQTLIDVKCPGELLDVPYPYSGHRGTRYYKGPEWDQLCS